MSDKHIRLLYILDKAEDVQRLLPQEIAFLKNIINDIETVIREKGDKEKEDYVKVKLTSYGWEIYKQLNGFAVSNIDDDGYSTFSLEYFNKIFYGFMDTSIMSNEIINFKK